MLYGDDKPRHMARSILPSKSREAARAAKRAVRRGVRRETHLAMHALARDPELFDETAGLHDYPDHEVRWVVQGRRSSDKLNHFMRWAEKVTEELPAQDRLSHIRSKVPEGVIGEHALFHLSHREAFESPQERELREAQRRAWAVRWRPKLMDRGEMAVLLRELIGLPGVHRLFNRWLQRHHVTHRRTWIERGVDPQTGRVVEVARSALEGPTRARKLLGAHDVLPFLDELERGRPGQPWHLYDATAHPEWLVATDVFLRVFKENGAVLEKLEARLREAEKDVKQRSHSHYA